MTITLTQLAASTGAPLSRAVDHLDAINAAMDQFDISNAQRQAAFLAQVGHESGFLQYLRELWGPTAEQAGYEGREDLGNTQEGDGFRFRGAGYLMTTGRFNFARTRDGLAQCGVDGVPDFEALPGALATPQWAAMSAAWFWFSHGCNALADRADFVGITRVINGGLNGEASRVTLWHAASAAFDINPGDEATA